MAGPVCTSLHPAVHPIRFQLIVLLQTLIDSLLALRRTKVMYRT
jgi:hypothetical protein